MGLLQQAYKAKGQTYTPATTKATGGNLTAARLASEKAKAAIAAAPAPVAQPNIFQKIQTGVTGLVNKVTQPYQAPQFSPALMQSITNLPPQIPGQKGLGIQLETPTSGASAQINPTVERKPIIETAKKILVGEEAKPATDNPEVLSQVKALRDTMTQKLNQARLERENFYNSVPVQKRLSRLIPGDKKQEEFELDRKVTNYQAAVRDLNQFLGEEKANKGVFAKLIENIKDPVKAFTPFLADVETAYNNSEAIKAVKKYERNEQLSEQEQSQVDRFRAYAYNQYVQKGLGDQVADVITAIPKFMMEMLLTKGLSAPAKPLLGTMEKIAMEKISNETAKKVVSKVIQNSVQMAIQGSVAFPAITARTSEYMLPTVDYEQKLGTGDILTMLKPGDDPGKAFIKGYATNLTDYITEGVGEYIDDAAPFVKKAFVGKWLDNKGMSDEPANIIEKLLRENHYSGIVAEVIEEEIGQPVQSLIEGKEYKDPFTTPEGRERLLVEVLGIGAFGGMAKVATTTTGKIQERRSAVKDVVDIPVETAEKEEVKAETKVDTVDPKKTSKEALVSIIQTKLEEGNAEFVSGLKEQAKNSPETIKVIETAVVEAKKRIEEKPWENRVAREAIKATKVPEGVSGVLTVKPNGTAGMSVHLTEAAQGKGFGTKVVKQLIAKAKSKGITVINISAELHANDGGKSSVGFWEKMGFVKSGEASKEFQPMTLKIAKKVRKPAKTPEKEPVKPSKTAQKTKPKEKPVAKTVYHGENKKVGKYRKSWGDVLVVKTSQLELIKKLSKEGNKEARALYSATPKGGKIDYGKADRIIREAYGDKYDAVQYNNENRKQIGTEYHDLANNKFYAENQAVAKLYAMQTRQKKYEKKEPTYKPATVADIEKYIADKKTKFREDQEQTSDLVILNQSKRITSKFFEWADIKTKKTAAWEYLNQSVNAGSLALKEKEKEIIKNVLDTKYAENKENGVKIDMAEFKRDVIDAMMSLDIIRSDTYSSYGQSEIQKGNLEATTYILNSPFEHGNTGHFSQDFDFELSEESVEIKEIPPQENNPTAKYAVVRKGVQLNEGNIEENVFTLTSSREAAQKWIDSRIDLARGAGFIKPRNKGLFGHFRTFDDPSEGISNVAELQSDTFQHLDSLKTDYSQLKDEISRLERENESGIKIITQSKNLENALKNKEVIKILEDKESYENSYRGRQLSDTTTFVLAKQFDIDGGNLQTLSRQFGSGDNFDFKGALNLIKERLPVVENSHRIIAEALDKARLDFSQLSIDQDEKLFLGYKNTWHERIIRELISIKANEGIERVRFATPRTVAFVEMYTSEDGDYIPYEHDLPEGSDTLSVGDEIEYGGEKMTVVSAEGDIIKVARSENVSSFDADTAMDEDITSRWEDVTYQFEKVEKDFGDVNTPEKAQAVLDAYKTLERFSRYVHRDFAIQQRKENYDVNSERGRNELQLEKIKEKIDTYERFIKLLEEDVIKKENITEENIGNVDFKDRLETKYNIPHSYWNYILDTYATWRQGYVSIEEGDTKLRAEKVIRMVTPILEDAKSELSSTETSLDLAKKQLDKDLEEIKTRKSPTAKELKGLPEKLIEEAKESKWSFGLDYEVESLLRNMAESDQEEVSPDDFEQEFRDKQAEDYEGNYEDSYGEDHVFYEEGYGGTQVWVVNDGDVETLGQPFTYDDSKQSSIEDFNIDEYSGEQKTVLKFYDQQVLPYVKKLRKGNAELVVDEDGFEWLETKITPEDVLPPLAYRIKDDLEKVGIKITDKQEKEIMALNNELFGDAGIKVTEQVFSNSKALGAYQKRIIHILDKQANPKDTFYHEAVHKYLDVFLDKSEHIDLLREAQQVYGYSDLSKVEERLAEDFITYAKKREGVTGKIRKFFDKLSKRIKIYLKNYSKIDKLYEDIITGQAKKTIVNDTGKSSKKPVDIEGLKKSSKAYSRVVDQMESEFQDDVLYNQMNLAEDAARAMEFVSQNPERALRIARGIELPPQDITETAISIVAADNARESGRYKLWSELEASRSLRQTRRGQEIVSERGRVVENSPEFFLKQVLSEREKIVMEQRGWVYEKKGSSKKTTISEGINEEVETARKKVNNRVKNNLDSAQDILNSLACK